MLLSQDCGGIVVGLPNNRGNEVVSEEETEKL